MRIVFISNLSSVKSLGPSWSVPARVKAQEKIDDVLWVNCTDAYIEHWSEVGCFHNLSEYGGKLTLSSLPSEYQNPDLVVFEDFYYPNCIKFHFELLKSKIPYIIVPRGALTSPAQNKKWFKKRIANFLMFSHFLKKALAIQYLTLDEYRDSTDKWNKNHVIIPNGISMPIIHKKEFSSYGINAVFIGRLNAYHKGIDLLIDAINSIKEELRKVQFTLKMYGELNRDYELLKAQVLGYGLEDLISFEGEAFDDRKKQVLQKADLFIMTSRFEGLPMGLLEALAYGVPVIVTPGTNMATPVREADAGWVTEPTIESIASSIMQAIGGRAEYDKKSKNARDLAAKYDWDILAQRFHDEIHLLLTLKNRIGGNK